MHHKLIRLSVLLLPFLATAARAEWQRDDTTLSWQRGGHALWKLSFDPKAGKPFFDPLRVGDGPSFTNFRPEDHPWHYGLWYSWKIINGANYWEEDRTSGRAEGATRWATPAIDVSPDGATTVRLDVTYTHPSGRVDVTERRELRISAPATDGSYSIDWRARFVAGKEGAVLDRTPMPGEPEGKVNGGYAGLGVRLAAPPITMSVVTPDGPVTRWESDRARPVAAAVACNFADGAKDLGGLAIFSDPANTGGRAAWYLINGAVMRFACAAILAPKPITLAPGAELKLRYRITLRRRAWTSEALETSAAGF
jgi:hypothetical protein